MKKTLLTLLSVLFCAITFAQSVPQGINYQAVARDANGDVLMNQALTIQLSVISDSATSAVSWQETHTVATNDFGLFTLVIGQGISDSTTIGSSATFDEVDWGASLHYLKVEVDYGNGFADMGTTALMSVPYALQAGHVENSINDLTDATNGLGSNSLFLGANSGNLNQIGGNWNTGVGINALSNVSTGNRNTALGYNALALTTSSNNTGLGSEALVNNQTGQQNTAVGSGSLNKNNSSNNTAFGYGSMYNTTTGGGNTVVGNNALALNITGSGNVAIGNSAGYHETGSNKLHISNSYQNASNPLIYGDFSTQELTINGSLQVTGTVNEITVGKGGGNIASNTAIGNHALENNTTGYENTANGYQALRINTTGYRNTAHGFGALYFNTSGHQNTAHGFRALYRNNTGYYNTAHGHSVLFNTTTGDRNTASGGNSMIYNTTGNDNTAYGYNALTTNTTGDKNTAIGSGANVAADSLTNAMAIGYGAVVDTSNKIQLGNSAVTSINTSGQLTTGAITYPKIDGATGEVLTTDGFGSALWATAYDATAKIDSLESVISTLDSTLNSISLSISGDTLFISIGNYIILPSSVPTLLGCTDSTATNYNALANTDDGSCAYPFSGAIGDTHQGGIVFWLDGNGGGLIAAPTDQSIAVQWGCYGTLLGADGDSIGSGSQNTIDIEAGCTTPGIAADICTNLIISGYSDWFLPSKDELNEMYLNIGQGNALGLGNVGNFANTNYHTSTEVDYIDARIQDFTNGVQDFWHKDFNYFSVRAVRAF